MTKRETDLPKMWSQSDDVTAKRITAVTLAVLAIQNFQFEKKHNLML